MTFQRRADKTASSAAFALEFNRRNWHSNDTKKTPKWQQTRPALNGIPLRTIFQPLTSLRPQNDTKKTLKWHKNDTHFSTFDNIFDFIFTNLMKKPKWRQNDIKMTPKWHSCVFERDSLWHQKDTKMTPKWHQNDIVVFLNEIHFGIKKTQKWHQNDTKMTQPGLLGVEQKDLLDSDWIFDGNSSWMLPSGAEFGFGFGFDG